MKDYDAVTVEDKNTLRAQAAKLATLGKAYTQLASRHRITASALERGQQKQITYEGGFSDWIFRVSEFSARAERLLALEIELARNFGVTWEEVASVLGVSRQAAWGRFSDPSRWQDSRRVSQQRAAHRAELSREIHNQIDASDEEELAALQDWFDRRARRAR
jgi:DNA-binding XRE family transcriptional regulator